MAAAVHVAAALARRLQTGVAVLAATATAAGLFLWSVLWWPVPVRLLPLLGAGGTFAVLLGPAVLLGLFYQGLHDLVALPDRVSDRAERTLDQSAEALRTVRSSTGGGWLGRAWHLLRQVWALRTVLMDNRALWLRYGTLLRFLTPGFLVLVAGATAVSLVLIPLAGLVGVIALLG